MFSGKDAALEHRDAVFEAFTEEFGSDHPMQISPILDGATLKVADLDPEEVQNALEIHRFTVKKEGEGPDGDWFELKVKP